MKSYLNRVVFLGKRCNYDSSMDFVERVFSSYFNMSPPKIARSKNMKPLFLNSDLYFSVSHKGDYISAIFSKFPIGIDMEILKPYPSKVSEKFFSYDEVNFIKQSEDKNLAFFKIWTGKEAFIKSQDLNLSFIRRIDYFKLNLFSFNYKSLIFSISSKVLNSDYIIEFVNS